MAEYGVSTDDATNHHELLKVGPDRFLLTSLPLVEVPDGTQQECTIANTGQASTATHVSGARIEEVDSAGNVHRWWEADVLGAAGPDNIRLEETTVRLCFERPETGERYLSSLHPNALNVRGDQVLMSARHADAIYAIDFWGTGKIVWKLGGTQRENVSLTVDGQQPNLPARQHDIEVLPNGNITLFDNRTPFSFATGPAVSGPARFVEYRLDLAARRATMVRQQARPNGDSSGALGSARVQPGGGVVINWGSVPGPQFTEFDADGNVLLEVSFSNQLDPSSPRFSYRTIKEPLEAFDLARLRATAGRSS